jgi:hypothetical protein
VGVHARRDELPVIHAENRTAGRPHDEIHTATACRSPELSVPAPIIECMFEQQVDDDFEAEFAALVDRFRDGGTPGLDQLPGPGLADLLGSVEPSALSEYDVVEAMAAWARLAAWATAGQLAMVAELARRREPDPSHSSEGWRYAADEVAAALAISGRAAGAQLALALELDRLPGTAAALAAGRIDPVKARVIAEATGPLPDPAARAVEDRVLPRAGTLTPGRLRAAVAEAVLAVDPAAAEQRHRRAAGERRVESCPLPDGIAELRAVGPADDIAAIFAALDAWARRAKTPGDGRGIDARRFDALADLAHLGLQDTGLPTGHRVRPHLQLTAPISTLLGLSDQPGELAGYGPIPASMVRRLAADATWRRLLTDPASGALLDYGRTTYRPPAPLADFVLARDKTCRFPGCRQPAHRCDLDHGVRYPDGPTAAGNLSALCRHHHRLKHETRWSVQQGADGSFLWTSPTGHRYLVEPEPLHAPEHSAYLWPTGPDPHDDPYPDDG